MVRDKLPPRASNGKTFRKALALALVRAGPNQITDSPVKKVVHAGADPIRNCFRAGVGGAFTSAATRSRSADPGDAVESIRAEAA